MSFKIDPTHGFLTYPLPSMSKNETVWHTNLIPRSIFVAIRKNEERKNEIKAIAIKKY